MKHFIGIVALIFITFKLSAGDDFCGITNHAFLSGERINFSVYYSVIGLFVHAGDASFNVGIEKYSNKIVYHVVGEGSSNSRYDWIFKVRDRYESYFDTTNLQPIKFLRNINEGGFKQIDDVTFNQKNNTATTPKGTYKVPNCVQDVLSAIYYARNIDFNRYHPGDKIPFSMFLDETAYNLYVKYEGKESIKTRYGRFNAIKFKPLLVKGTMFEGGEKMTVWVSDDANHIPLRVESPILVGSVKVDMMGYSNLRYPLSSMINKR